MAYEIPVTQARADFAELVNRVVYGDERIVVTRHGRPLVALVPAADLVRLDALDATDSAAGSRDSALDDAALGDQDREAAPPVTGRPARLVRLTAPDPGADEPARRFDVAARHNPPGRTTRR